MSTTSETIPIEVQHTSNAEFIFCGSANVDVNGCPIETAVLRREWKVQRQRIDDFQNRVTHLEEKNVELIDALRQVLLACDNGTIVEKGIGGMSVEAQTNRSYYMNVFAPPIFAARNVFHKYQS